MRGGRRASQDERERERIRVNAGGGLLYRVLCARRVKGKGLRCEGARRRRRRSAVRGTFRSKAGHPDGGERKGETEESFAHSITQLISSVCFPILAAFARRDNEARSHVINGMR